MQYQLIIGSPLILLNFLSKLLTKNREFELWKRIFGELEEWVSKVKADTPNIKLAAENKGTVASLFFGLRFNFLKIFCIFAYCYTLWSCKLYSL